MKCVLFWPLLLSWQLCFGQHPCQEYILANTKHYQYQDTIVLGSNAKQPKIIMVGERHFIPINTAIHFALVRSYHQVGNLDAVFIEFPPSISYFIQSYMDSGNEEWLTKAFEGAPYQAYNQHLFRKIRALNEKRQHPIRIIGIDLEVGGLNRPIKVLSQLSPYFTKQKENNNLQELIQALQQKDPTSNTSNAFLKFYASFQKKRKLLSKKLGTNFLHADLLMENLKEFIPLDPEKMFSMDFQIKRDSFMYQNLLRVYQSQKFQQAYIAMGATHVEKLKDHNHRRLSHFLAFENTSPFKRGLLTARINYKGFKRDAQGHELRFQEFLDNTSLSSELTQQLFSTDEGSIGLLSIDNSGYSCTEKEAFDVLIYLNANH